MGSGPFNVGGAILGSADDPGQDVSVVFSGIREVWVRNVYLRPVDPRHAGPRHVDPGGVLSIPEQGVIVDLGANRGTFTALALARSPGCFAGAHRFFPC